jgi:hypothetical protein
MTRASFTGAFDESCIYHPANANTSGRGWNEPLFGEGDDDRQKVSARVLLTPRSKFREIRFKVRTGGHRFHMDPDADS